MKFQTGDIELDYSIHGEGALTMVFIHGMSCDQHDWDAQIEYFKNKYRILVFDLRGHGSSTKDLKEALTIEQMASDVLELLKILKMDNIILLGHSMGCRIAMEIYQRNPELITHLILIDGSHRGTDGDPIKIETETRARINNPENLKAMRLSFQRTMAQITKPEIAQLILAKVKSTPAGLGRGLAPTMLAWDARYFVKIIEDLNMPVLLLQSTFFDFNQDRKLLKAGESSPYLELMKEKVTDITIKVISPSGHFPMMEKPDEVNEAIKEFLNSREK